MAKKKFFGICFAALILLGLPNEVFSAGKFDGIWSGKLSCFHYLTDDRDMGSVVDPSSQININVQLNIKNSEIIEQSGFPSLVTKPFSGKIDAGSNRVKIKSFHTLMGLIALDGKFLFLDKNIFSKNGKFIKVIKERLIKFDGVAEDERECQFYLALLLSGDKKANQFSKPKSIISKPKGDNAVGTFDGIWTGELSCFFYLPDDRDYGQIVDDSTEIKSIVQLDIEYNKLAKHSGFPTSGNKTFSGKIDAPEKNIRISASHSEMGALSLDGKFHNVEGDRFIKFEGEASDGRECGFYMKLGLSEPKQAIPTPKISPVPSEPKKKLVPVPNPTIKPKVLSAPNPVDKSIVGRLKKLQGLLEKGLITQDEAAKKRQEILDGL
jgi:hypothetical protein